MNDTSRMTAYPHEDATARFRRNCIMRCVILLISVSTIIGVGYLSNYVTRLRHEEPLIATHEWFFGCAVIEKLPYYVTIYEYQRDRKMPYGELSIERYVSFFGYLYNSGREKRKYDPSPLDRDYSKWKIVDDVYGDIK